MNQMKALLIDGPRKIRFAETPVPEVGPDEVLVKVHCMGVCATDLEVYQGNMAYFLSGQASYPIIPGHEWSGEIVTVGNKVKKFAPGDRVTGEITIACGRCSYCLKGAYNMCPDRMETGLIGMNGAAAQYMVYPAFALYRFAPTISFEEAALLEPSAIAYRGVSKLNVHPGDRVAIIGAGPIGLLAVQVAKAFGAHHVALFDYRDNRLQAGLELGADAAVNLTGVDSLDAILPRSPEDRFTAIVEASGHTSAVESILDYAAPTARIVLIGFCGGEKASIDVDRLVTYDLEVHGSLGSPGVWDATIKMLESGKLRTRPLISHRFPLDRLEQVFHMMERKDPTIVKIMMQVGGNVHEQT